MKSGKSKIKATAAIVSVGCPISHVWYLLAVSSHSRRGYLLGTLSMRALIPITRAPDPITSKGLPPNTITLGVKTSTHEFQGM